MTYGCYTICNQIYDLYFDNGFVYKARDDL